MSTATISADAVKRLREETGAGMMECKRALVEAAGDFAKATEILRERGALTAAKKAGREANEGAIASYIHMGGKIGVLVEVNCETDFVAKNDSFKNFVRDITLHVAASAPQYVSREEVPADRIDGEPEKFYAQTCLLDQAFVKNPDETVRDVLTKAIQEIGENIVIRRFVRYQLGETTAA
jgi:elongation factor Ts